MILLLIDKLNLKHLTQEKNFKFVVAMDNYFTYPRVMAKLRELGIGVVGTARNRSGWPPKELVLPENSTFNSLVWSVDDFGTMVVKWIDNNQVFLVSTVHTANQSIERPRKRPRQTNTNRHHLSAVWNNGPVRNINIPRLVDDYNHWMCGTDLGDQLISYYAADLRFRRTWMPLFFQCIQIIRINSFIVFKELSSGSIGKDAHKLFILDGIAFLRKQAKIAFTNTLNHRSSSNANPTTETSGRTRQSHINPVLPDRRLTKPFSLHERILSEKQGRCTMCSYIRMQYLQSPEHSASNAPKCRRPKRKCSYCKVHLCETHFNLYHGE